MNASGKTTKTLVWILMGMLILGLGGFGVTNLGGSVRTIGSVGDKPITTQSYSRALQQMLRGQVSASGGAMSFAEAQSQQLDRLVLSQLIAARSLDSEAAQLGLSVGDERLAAQILSTDAFRGVNGEFNRDDYRFRLQQIGLTEREYEEIVREEIARGIVQTAMFSNIEPTPSYAETIVQFIGEKRDFKWAIIDENTLAEPLSDPSTEELEAFYSQNQSRYMTPDLRNITYAILTPEQMIEQVEVDENTLRQLYEERATELNRPERRLVERLIISDEKEAEAAATALNNRETSFENLVKERGLELGDIDMGDVTLQDLGDAGEAVFAAQTGDIVGPLQTSLGPALFRVNGVLAAVTTEFADVRDELRDEFAQGRARRLIDNERDAFDDLLASGATLEELASETIMELGQIEWHSRSEAGPAGYAAFREAADRITTEDFPELLELDDGGLIALRLDGEVPSVAQPLEEVRERVIADERQSRLIQALSAKARDLSDQIAEGNDFDTLGVSVRRETDMTRTDFLPEAPAGFMVDLFALKSPGETTVSQGGSTVTLAQLETIISPNPNDESLESTRQLLEDQYSNDIAQDMYNMFITDIQARTPIILDETAINAVNAQF